MPVGFLFTSTVLPALTNGIHVRDCVTVWYKWAFYPLVLWLPALTSLVVWERLCNVQRNSSGLSIPRYCFALQIRRDLDAGELHCSENTAALLASYIVQGISHFIFHVSLVISQQLYFWCLSCHHGCNRLVMSVGELTLGPFPCQLILGGVVLNA